MKFVLASLVCLLSLNLAQADTTPTVLKGDKAVKLVKLLKKAGAKTEDCAHGVCDLYVGLTVEASKTYDENDHANGEVFSGTLSQGQVLDHPESSEIPAKLSKQLYGFLSDVHAESDGGTSVRGFYIETITCTSSIMTCILTY